MKNAKYILAAFAAIVFLTSLSMLVARHRAPAKCTGDFCRFEGTYRGVSPTDDSAVGMGEMEVIIKDDHASVRFATGSRIEETKIALSDLRKMTTAEMSTFLGTDGESFEGTVHAFKPQDKDVPMFVFASEERGEECAQLLIRFGTMSDLLGPTVMFCPSAVARGEFDAAVKKVDELYWSGALPSLKNGGKAAPKPTQTK